MVSANRISAGTARKKRNDYIWNAVGYKLQADSSPRKMAKVVPRYRMRSPVFSTIDAGTRWRIRFAKSACAEDSLKLAAVAADDDMDGFAPRADRIG
jgi:hypothetical protein